MIKRILLLFICIFFFQRSNAQCNNDSIVVHLSYYYASAVDSLYSSVQESAFNNDSGTVTNSLTYSTHHIPWTQPAITNNYFQRTDTSNNSNGYPTFIVHNTSSAGGWIPDSAVSISYNADNFRTEYFKLFWNGAGWDSLSYQTWTYDSSNHIISTAIYFRNGSAWDNKNRTDITFVNDHPDTKIILQGSGINWMNSKKYVFTYSNTLRTLVDLYDADSIGVWNLKGQYPYQLNDSNQYVIRIVDTLPGDTTITEIDTLENTVHYAEWVVTEMSWYPDYEEYYRYIDSTLLLVYSSYAEVQGGTTIDRPDGDYYSYDNHHRVIYHSSWGRCTNPCGGETTYAYDVYGRPTQVHIYGWTMVSDRYINDDWIYLDSSELKIIVPVVENELDVCRDSLYQPQIFVFGGCPPYHYQWTPSNGLSSDTVLRPFISASDTVNYTIHAYDNFGNSDSAQYRIRPYNEDIHVTEDSIACDGLATLSIHWVNHLNTFSWYLDSTSNIVGNSWQILMNTPGNYWCRMEYDFWSTHQFRCTSISDTLTLLAAPVVTISQSNDTIFTTYDAASYDWYLDSVFLSTTSDPYLVITQPGDYFVTVADTVLCPRQSNVLTAIILSTQNLPGGEFYIINNSDFHSITVINKTNENDYFIRLTDMTGKLVYTKRLSGRKNEINLETIPAGIYLLNIKSEGRIISKKIIKN